MMTEATADAQELARLRAIVNRVERTREAMQQIARESVDRIQRAAWVNAEIMLADALNGTGPFGASEREPTRYWTIWTDDRREIIAQVSGPELVDADAALRAATTKPYDYEHTKANSYVEEADETGFNVLLDWDALSEDEKRDLRPQVAEGGA